MITEPIFLQPAFQERIWGGEKLKTKFNYDIPSKKTGEAWIISAHEQGSSIVINGEFKGSTLKDVWENHSEIFGEEKNDKEFPLLVKILDANDDLSVQVHPGDKYAQEIEGVSYGKTECWYVLEAETNAEIVFGHNAESKEEFQRLVEDKEWDKLLRYEKVSKGDFFYVPSGTIHALGQGLVILEIQQSSDVTYRLYDYDRKDSNGELRQLHIDSSLKVAKIPHKDSQKELVVHKGKNIVDTCLIESKYFTVYHWQIQGLVNFDVENNMLLMNVVSGKGELKINNVPYPLKKGDNFIITKDLINYSISGKLELIVSHE